MLSLLMSSMDLTPYVEAFPVAARGKDVAGEGTISGFMRRSANVPVTPTTAERMNPGLDLSIKYQSTGFASANVKDTWRVDCHGSFLCETSITCHRSIWLDLQWQKQYRRVPLYS